MRWKRGLAGRGGFGGVEILLILGLVAAVGAVFGPRERVETDRVLDVRPAGAIALAADSYLPDELAEKIRSIPGVARVTKYLYVSLGEGTTHGPLLMVASEFPASPLDARGKLRILEGKSLGAEDAGKRVAIVGTLFAERHAPPGQHTLPLGATIELGGSPVEIVGIFESSVPLVDQQILLPLETGQRLFGLEGKVSGLFVVLESAQDRERVAEALWTTLGEVVDVISPD